MKRIAAFLACAALLLCMLPAAVADTQVVNVFNCYDYMASDVFALFEKETGIHVNPMYYTTNEEMLIQLEANEGAFDVIFPSDYAMERMIADDLLAPINFDNVPNYRYVMESLTGTDYDPDNQYGVPYMWGTVGILYNTTKTNGPIDSWGAMFDPQYAGEILMMTSMRDTMGVALKYLGYSMNTRNPQELQAATAALIKQKKDGLVKAYYVDETKDAMAAGDGTLGLVWSGDAQYAIDENPDLAYAVPKEGSNIWIDFMVIPKDAQNKENAEKFIDFLCRPDIAQMNCEEIRYSSPNTGAIELMGAEYADNKTMNPDQATIDNCEFFKDIQDFITIYDTLWGQVINTK